MSNTTTTSKVTFGKMTRYGVDEFSADILIDGKCVGEIVKEIGFTRFHDKCPVSYEVRWISDNGIDDRRFEIRSDRTGFPLPGAARAALAEAKAFVRSCY